MSKKPKEKMGFETFEGVYCSGFFINDPALMTTMSLLFDKVHILNNLEFVIEFSNKYAFDYPKEVAAKRKEFEITLTPAVEETVKDPFCSLNDRQKKTAYDYLFFAYQFLIENHELVGTVINTDMLPNGDVFDVQSAKLVKQGILGEPNTYEVKIALSDLRVSLDSSNLDSLLERGVIPFFSGNDTALPTNKLGTLGLAALIGIKAVQMVLPPFKAVKPEVILEARSRLSNQLPLFWAAMLKTATQMKLLLQQGATPEEVDQECRELVQSFVRPALIEVKYKIDMERKQWFHKIISRVGNGIKVCLGNPPLSTVQYISTGLKLGTDLVLDANDFIGKNNLTATEKGLALLIETDKIFRTQNRNG